MKNEKEMSKFLVDGLRELECHVERVESHTASPGIPDLDGMFAGIGFKIELKFESDTISPKVRANQKNWMRHNIDAGGIPWALLLYKSETMEKWILIMGGTYIQFPTGSTTYLAWEREAYAMWDGPINMQELVQYVCALGRPPEKESRIQLLT